MHTLQSSCVAAMPPLLIANYNPMLCVAHWYMYALFGLLPLLLHAVMLHSVNRTSNRLHVVLGGGFDWVDCCSTSALLYDTSSHAAEALAPSWCSSNECMTRRTVTIGPTLGTRKWCAGVKAHRVLVAIIVPAKSLGNHFMWPGIEIIAVIGDHTRGRPR